MKFKPGMLGACVVVLALLGTVLIGYNIGADEVTEYRTNYRNITNITSQFHYSEGDEFTSYNPAQNYTGYTPGTIEFTESGTANQYSYIVTPGTHQTQTVDLTDTTWYSTNDHENDSRTFVGSKDNWWLLGGYHMSVSSFLTHEGISYSSYENGVVIDLLYGTPYNFYTNDMFVATPNLVTVATTAALQNNSVVSNGFVHEYTDPDNGIYFTDGTPWYWTLAYRPYAYSNSDFELKIHVLKTGETRILYNGSVTDISTAGNTFIFWSDMVCYTTLSGAVTPAGLNAPFNNQMGNAPNYQIKKLYTDSITPTAMLTVDYDVGTVAKYMRVSEGISFVPPTEYSLSGDPYASTWTNSHENGSISWVIKMDTLASGPFFLANPIINGGMGIQVFAYTVGGQIYVGYNDGAYNNTVVLGAWNTIRLTFDSVNRKVTCAPITSFSDFQNYTESPMETVIADSFPIYDNIDDTLLFDSVMFIVNSDNSTRFKFSVTETVVRLGFNKNIFIGPYLNPRTLFLSADYPILRITFDSVALLGDTVTINNHTYNVSNGAIGIDGNIIPISGMNVTYKEDNHIYVNDIDVGASVNNTISFGGQWYFQARASYGYLESVEVVDWQIGEWAIDMQQAVLIYEACIVAGIIIAYYKKSLTTLDWAILIFAMFGGAVLF